MSGSIFTSIILSPILCKLHIYFKGILPVAHIIKNSNEVLYTIPYKHLKSQNLIDLRGVKQ